MFQKRQQNLFPSLNKQKRYKEKTPSFLKRIETIVDFENFRNDLVKALDYKSNAKTGGRPPIDPILMFKIMVIQKFYNYGDDAMEFSMHDSLSLQAFIGVGQYDDMPDSKTLWLFRDRLSKHNNIFETLFQRLQNTIEKAGFKAKAGQIIDAT